MENKYTRSLALMLFQVFIAGVIYSVGVFIYEKLFHARHDLSWGITVHVAQFIFIAFCLASSCCYVFIKGKARLVLLMVCFLAFASLYARYWPVVPFRVLSLWISTFSGMFSIVPVEPLLLKISND